MYEERGVQIFVLMGWSRRVEVRQCTLHGQIPLVSTSGKFAEGKMCYALNGIHSWTGMREVSATL